MISMSRLKSCLVHVDTEILFSAFLGVLVVSGLRERRNKNENTFQEKLMFSSHSDAEFHAISSLNLINLNNLYLEIDSGYLRHYNTTGGSF